MTKKKDPYSGDAPVPNVYFTTTDEEHGEIEVSAWVPPVRPTTNEKVVIVGVGAPSDIHITTEEAGIVGLRLEKLKTEAVKQLTKKRK